MGSVTPHLSVVLPIYNEAPGLPALFLRLADVLEALPFSYEVIAVDDGSKDNSYTVLVDLKKQYPHLSVIGFRANAGQTAALSAGIDAARGEIIVTMDSDLENDPADIPALVQKLESEGHAVVSGWRQGRWKNATFTRRLPSYVANKLISRATGVPLHDYGCTLKAYRADAIKDVRLYGDMHRFVAAYAVWQGGTIAELPVRHTPRVYGKSNYGFGRTFRVLLDLVVLVFMRRFMSRPMHFFGLYGSIALALGCVAGFVAIALRVLNIEHFVETPLPILSAFLILVGVQLVLFGVVAEILVRTYFESQHKRPYSLRQDSGKK